MTLVEGNPKAPFSIDTTPRCRREHYSIPWIAPLYPWALTYAVLSKAASSTIFWVFGMTQPGIHLLAEWYDTKSSIKLGGFWSQLQASYVSSNTEELWYNKTVCLWMTIYIYIYI